MSEQSEDETGNPLGLPPDDFYAYKALLYLIYALPCEKGSPLLTEKNRVLHGYVMHLFGIEDVEAHKKYFEDLYEEAQYYPAELNLRLECLSGEGDIKYETYADYYGENAWADDSAKDKWHDEEEKFVGDCLNALKEKKFKGGLISVNVFEARDLLGKDKSGTSDPFCTLYFDSTKKSMRDSNKTRMIPEDLNPVWNEVFDLEPDPESTELSIYCWDHDKMSKNDFLGRVLLPFEMLVRIPFNTSWFVLQKRSRRSNVSGDIRLGWDTRAYMFSGKMKLPSSHFSKSDFHQILSSVIVKMISTTDESMENIDTTLALVSAYCHRFGVSSQFAGILIVKTIVEKAAEKLHVYPILANAVANIVKHNDNGSSMTKNESKFFESCKEGLCRLVDEKLEGFPEIFPRNKPEGALKATIEVHAYMKSSWIGDYKGLEDYLRGWIRVELDKCRENPPEFSGKVKAIEKDMATFSHSFDGNLPLWDEFSVVIYSMLWDHAKQMLKEVEIKEAFNMYAAMIHFRDAVFENAEAAEDILGPMKASEDADSYAAALEKWIEQLSNEFKTVAVAMGEEEGVWEAKKDFEYQSPMIPRFFGIVNEKYQVLYSFGEDVLNKLFPQFANAVADGVNGLVVMIEALCEDASESAARTPIFELKENDIPVTITKEMCVRLNSVNLISTKMEEFVSSFEEERPELVKEVVQSCIPMLRKSFVGILNSIADELSTPFQLIFADYSEAKSLDDVMNKLEDYLDNYFAELYVMLGKPTFRQLMKAIYVQLIEDIMELIAPLSMGAACTSSASLKIFDDNFFEDLSAYFNAEGEGVNLSFIEKEEQPLKNLIALFRKSTEELIEIHKNLVAKGDSGDDNPDDIAGVKPERIISILSGKAENKTAVLYSKKVRKEADSVSQLIEKFNLPSGEKLKHSWFSLDADSVKLTKGELHLTTNFVCYSSLGFVSESLKVLKLSSITEISKKRMFVIHDNELDFVTDSGRNRFWGFSNRNKVFEIIVQRIENSGDAVVNISEDGRTANIKPKKAAKKSEKKSEKKSDKKASKPRNDDKSAVESSDTPNEDKDLAKGVVKQGFLMKQGHYWKNWKKRWFVLTKESLSYSKRENADSIRVLNLRGGVVEIDDTMKGKPHLFKLTPLNPTPYYIQADSDEERDEWIAEIKVIIWVCSSSVIGAANY